MINLFRRIYLALKRRADPMYLRWWLRNRAGRNEFYSRPPGSKRGVIGRSKSSDAMVYRQIFVNEEYGCVERTEDVDTIIDLGANVGYSSVYLLSRHPRARLIAVEPDPENFELLSCNLAPFRRRAQVLLAAAWSHQTRLRLRAEPYRGGGHWARQVEPSSDGAVEALDVETLMSRYSINRLSILKMDIEGAEVAVFSGNLDWIKKVDVMMIELHDDSSFGAATSKIVPILETAGFRHRRHGELTIFERHELVSVPDDRQKTVA